MVCDTSYFIFTNEQRLFLGNNTTMQTALILIIKIVNYITSLTKSIFISA